MKTVGRIVNKGAIVSIGFGESQGVVAHYYGTAAQARRYKFKRWACHWCPNVDQHKVDGDVDRAQCVP
jgi:hypothetical protein